jgi:hypothetical protein
MSTSPPETSPPRARRVSFAGSALVVDLDDGRSVSAPLEWYPRLSHANPEEREHWRLIGQGGGIHWPDLDEDIKVDDLLSGRRSMEGQPSLRRWLERRELTQRH